jgi:hypothetical protein
VKLRGAVVDHLMVPPGRLELPPPASEAGALSTELRGRSPWSIADITAANGTAPHVRRTDDITTWATLDYLCAERS